MSRFTAECAPGGPCRILDGQDGTIVAVIPSGPYSEQWAARILAQLEDTQALSTRALEQGWVRLASELTGRLLNPTGHTDWCMETVALRHAAGMPPVCGRICGALRALRSATLGAPVRAAPGVLGAPWDAPIPVLAPDAFSNPRISDTDKARA